MRLRVPLKWPPRPRSLPQLRLGVLSSPLGDLTQGPPAGKDSRRMVATRGSTMVRYRSWSMPAIKNGEQGTGICHAEATRESRGMKDPTSFQKYDIKSNCCISLLLYHLLPLSLLLVRLVATFLPQERKARPLLEWHRSAGLSFWLPMRQMPMIGSFYRRHNSSRGPIDIQATMETIPIIPTNFRKTRVTVQTCGHGH